MDQTAWKSVNDLLEEYASDDERDRMLRLYELTDFLSECVIRRGYKIPDALNNALKLSPYGTSLVTKASKQGVPPKVARLSCLLEFFYLDLLIDPIATDADEVAEVISDEIRQGHILLPFVFGPALYTKAANLFEDERRFLSTADTLKLLEDEPQGVFHFGPWLSGPFGLLRTTHHRGISPTRRVPLQHCHDVSCRNVHPTALQSDQNAEINRRRSDISEILRYENDQPSEFAAFLGELTRDLTRYYDDTDFSALPYLLGDAMSIRELSAVLSEVTTFDKAVSDLVCSTLGEVELEDFLEDDPDRASMLQLLLLADDVALRAAIDSLVIGTSEARITIPPGEVRRSVLTNAHSTTFGNRPEISNLGIRVNSRGELGPLRLRRLVETLFRSTGQGDASAFDEVEELSWQLREVAGITVAGRLDEYLRSAPPDEVLQRLVLTTKTNVDVATDLLGLSAENVDDDTLVNRILWKLGFDVSDASSMHERFWTLHERMVHGARSANISTIVDQEAMRGLGANYFVALEKLLADTISFATWALTVDHVTAKHPFAFGAETDHDQYLAPIRDLLNQRGARTDVKLEKWTLYPLVASFGALADHLDSLRGEATTFLRPDADRPEFAGNTTLEQFPLDHTVPFVDLTPASQTEILRVLRAVSDDLVNASVHKVRNEQLHYTRASSSLDQLLTALQGVDRAVRSLEDAGFTRVLFYPDRQEGDRWGRTTFYFSDRGGREVAFGRPSQFSRLNMPRMGTPQYLLHAAQFAEPNEILRFGLRAGSDFQQLWADFPLRRRRAVDWSVEEAPSGPQGSTSHTPSNSPI